MKCLICNNESIFFMKKTSFKVEYQEMVKDFTGFTYYKCTKCGFTVSKTHMEIPSDLWLKLNNDVHHYIENNSAPINQPPYLEQATIINVLNSHGIVSFNNAIDFAGGYGTLSKILKKYHKITLPVYDPYVTTENEGVTYIEKNALQI